MNQEDIAAKIDNEGFDYWLVEYYDRAECAAAGLTPETLDKFDAARDALDAAKDAADAEGLFD